MTQAAQTFIDSCERIGIPLPLAAVALKEDRSFEMEDFDTRIIWRLYPDNCASMVILFRATGTFQEYYFWNTGNPI